MTAKQYLGRVRRVDREISALLRMVEKTRESVTSITQKYDSDGAQSTKDPHKFDKLAELESLVDEKVDQLVDLKAEVLNTIMQLDDARHRIVLIEYYLKMKTFEEIAADNHYSWRQVHRHHGAALQKIQHVMECHTHSVV